MTRSICVFVLASSCCLVFGFEISVSPTPAKVNQPMTLLVSGSVSNLTWYVSNGGNSIESTENPVAFTPTKSGGVFIFAQAIEDGTKKSRLVAAVAVEAKIDTDSDGSPDDIETRLGTNPTEPVSAPATFGPFASPGLFVSKFKTANGSKKDTINIKASVFFGNVVGDLKRITLYCGGVVRTFALTSSGTKILATSDDGTDKLRVSRSSVSILTLTAVLETASGVVRQQFERTGVTAGTSCPIFLLLDNQITAYTQTFVVGANGLTGVKEATSVPTR